MQRSATMKPSPPQQPTTRSRKRIALRVLGVVLLIVAVVIGTATAANLYYKQQEEDRTAQPSTTTSTTASTPIGVGDVITDSDPGLRGEGVRLVGTGLNELPPGLYEVTPEPGKISGEWGRCTDVSCQTFTLSYGQSKQVLVPASDTAVWMKDTEWKLLAR